MAREAVVAKITLDIRPGAIPRPKSMSVAMR
jgi:hypothetical protein